MTSEAPAVLDLLQGRGLGLVEVYRKRGRSRRMALLPGSWEDEQHSEEGWAVRAGDRRGSFFAAGSGPLRRDRRWPDPDGHPLRLPPPLPDPRWSRPASFDRPLASETEGRSLLEAVARSLDEELPGARLRLALLEDGSSSAELTSSTGVSAVAERRLATLRLEAVDPGGAVAVTVEGAEREARRFHPVSLARRLADRLAVLAAARPPRRDRGGFLLAPPVAARLVAGLMPLWLGPRGEALARGLAGGDLRLGSRLLTVVDDGRLADGVLAAPVDGEGVPTGAVSLVEEGAYRRPLLAWWQAEGAGERATGCSHRPGWRDLPRPAPSHLFVAPDREVGTGDLLASLTRGHYLLDADGPGRFDLRAGRFALPVYGFEVQGGRATAPFSGGWLCGSIPALLRGVQGVARDLTFLPLEGMIGSPSLLVFGVELRHLP